MAMRSSQVPTWRGLLAFALAALLLAAAAPETEARTGVHCGSQQLPARPQCLIYSIFCQRPCSNQPPTGRGGRHPALPRVAGDRTRRQLTHTRAVTAGLSGRRALKGAESAVRLTAGGTSATGGLGNAFTGGNSNRVSLTLGQPASSGTALTPPLGVLHTANPGATAASTAGSTPTPAVSLTILPAYVTGVTSATTSGATTPQTLQARPAAPHDLQVPVLEPTAH